MLFNNKKEVEVSVKAPNYWEIFSYLIFPIKEEYINRDVIIKKLEKFKDIKVLGIAEPSDEKDGRILFQYNKNKYEVFYYFNKFKMPGLLDNQLEDFNDEELIELTKCNN